MIERLAHQHNLLMLVVSASQSVHGLFIQTRLQNIFEILFAEQIEAIARNTAQQHVEKPGSTGSSGKVCGRTEKRHQSHTCPAPPPFSEALRIPGKKADLAKRAQLQQRAFHSPISWHPRASAGQWGAWSWREI